MQNFHYHPQPKNQQLYQELQEIDRDLQEKKLKLQAQKKLQQEFYEDNRNMGLADDIMNQLLGNKKPTQQPLYQQKNNADHYIQRQQYVSPPPAKQHAQIYQKEQKTMQYDRKENNFVNPRELQKMKLQNRNAVDDYPFGRNESRQKPVVRSPPRQAPQRDIAPRSLQKANRRKIQIEDKPFQNPFVKNDIDLNKKREEQERNYRRLLQEQIEQQKRRKKQQQQKYKKEYSEAFNNYVPIGAKQNQQKNEGQRENVQNISAKPKKRDPNGDFPVYDNQSKNSSNHQSDLAFMKLQVDDLKNKFKKGRINHEQYENQCKKLELHYSIKISELQGDQKKKETPVPIQEQYSRQDAISKNLSKAKDMQDFQAQNRSDNYLKSQKNQQTIENQEGSYERKNLPNFSDFPQQMQKFSQDNYSMQYGYPQQAQIMSQMMGNMMGSNPTEMQLQMMMKIFDEFKGIIKLQHESQMDLLNEKKLWHETMSKMSPYFMPQNQNPNMFTQQVPQMQNQQNQKEYFSDVKKFERYDQIPKINRNSPEIISNQYGDSETSNSYIEKSLSAVVNKIPLTKKQKQKQMGENHRQIEQFYERKYKVKKFKPFEYTESMKSSSTNPIPSVSNYLQSTDSQDELNYLFQRDLRNYKKFQKQKQLEMMKKKLDKNTSKSGIGKSQISSISQSQYEQSSADSKIIKFLKDDASDLTESNKRKKSPPSDKKRKKSPHRNYRKQQQNEKNNKGKHKKQKSKHKQKEQQEPKNPFLKKHISTESYQPPTFQQKDFRDCDFVNSPPQQKSSQILEQEEYQTEPRKYEDYSDEKNVDKNPPPPHKPNFTKNKDNASAKILDIMKTNNQLLSKYEQTPSKSSLPSIRESVPSQSNRTVESRDYFSSHDISPVQRREYQSSLQTVRSQQQSVRLQRKNNMDLLMMGSAERNHPTLVSQYNSPVVTVHQSPSIESIEFPTEKKSEENSEKKMEREREKYPHIIGYSQTVESIQESSGKFPSFNRPPIVNSKKTRSTSRKKQSVVKLGNDNRSLSGITSEGSRQKSSLVKPPEYQGDKVMQNNSSVKFDSNVYESNYEASVSKRTYQVKQDDYYNFEPKVDLNEERQQQQEQHQRNESIEKQNANNFEDANEEKRRSEISVQSQKPDSKIISSSAAPTHKWKSLEEARKIAKQFRQRSGQDHNRSSVQQKLSELQSFINTSKKDDSIIRTNKNSGVMAQTPQTKKKDILKMLDDLGEDQDYQADFQSYKEESQR